MPNINNTTPPKLQVNREFAKTNSKERVTARNAAQKALVRAKAENYISMNPGQKSFNIHVDDKVYAIKVLNSDSDTEQYSITEQPS